MMIGRKHESYLSFYNALDLGLKDEKGWENTYENITEFIDENIEIIGGQTNNPYAQDLQTKLITLSNRINEKFTTFAAHNLAFEIMGIASGIFSKEANEIDYFSRLPAEIRQKIYAELTDMLYTKYSIFAQPIPTALRFVSKAEKDLVDAIKIAWINTEHISLLSSGCKSNQDAIKYIKQNQNLYHADFSGLGYVNLIQLLDCTWIQHLTIEHEALIDVELKFLKCMPLKSIAFSRCYRLTDKALKHLNGMLQLQSVEFAFCGQLTDKALKYLRGMPLKSVNFPNCYQLTGKAFKYLKRMPLETLMFRQCYNLTDKAFKYINRMPLKTLEFSRCYNLTDKVFEYLKGKQLQSVHFDNCQELTDKSIECLIGMPLRSVNFFGCQLLTDQALEYLKGMPLQRVDLSMCDQLTLTALENFKKDFTSRGLALEIFFHKRINEG